MKYTFGSACISHSGGVSDMEEGVVPDIRSTRQTRGAEVDDLAVVPDSPQPSLSGSMCIKDDITTEFLAAGGFFDLPLSRAAELLGLSAGALKRVCRKLGLARWPYRVRKSLRAVIAKTEEFMEDSDAGESKHEVLEALKAQMEDVKGISGQGIDGTTRRYRQAIFKLNHKIAKKATTREHRGKLKVPTAAAEQMRHAAPHRLAELRSQRDGTPQITTSSCEDTATLTSADHWPTKPPNLSGKASFPEPQYQRTQNPLQPGQPSPWRSPGPTQPLTPEQGASLPLSPYSEELSSRGRYFGPVRPRIYDSTLVANNDIFPTPGHHQAAARDPYHDAYSQVQKHLPGHGQAHGAHFDSTAGRGSHLHCSDPDGILSTDLQRNASSLSLPYDLRGGLRTRQMAPDGFPPTRPIPCISELDMHNLPSFGTRRSLLMKHKLERPAPICSYPDSDHHLRVGPSPGVTSLQPGYDYCSRLKPLESLVPWELEHAQPAAGLAQLPSPERSQQHVPQRHLAHFTQSQPNRPVSQLALGDKGSADPHHSGLALEDAGMLDLMLDLGLL